MKKHKLTPPYYGGFTSCHRLRVKKIGDSVEVIIKYTCYPTTKKVKYFCIIKGRDFASQVTANYNSTSYAIKEAIAILRRVL